MNLIKNSAPNPIEDVWKDIKREIYISDYETLNGLKDLFTDLFYEIVDNITYYENCDYAIANHIISNLLQYDYAKLSKKYPLIKVDYPTQYITEMVADNFGYYVKFGLESYKDPEGVCKAVIKDYNKLYLPTYDRPKYIFKSNEHRELINSLIQ